MSTYDGAYSTPKVAPSNPEKPKVKKKYKVLEANIADVYHYHGSWFEYTWDLTLQDENSQVIKEKLDTWYEYKPEQLVNQTIEYDGTTFDVVKE